MKNAIYVILGLIFTISGVMGGFVVHSHSPDSIGMAILDKDNWVYNSYEAYYFAMGCACLVAGIGFIGLLQHLFIHFVSDNKPNISPANDNYLNILPVDDKKLNIPPVNDNKDSIIDTKEKDFVRQRPGTIALAFFIIFILGMLIISFFSKAWQSIK